MLTLQRASAGSGKTFTLAKTYIRLLISIAEENRPPRLRKDAEIQDSVSHILAVTFTNKATNEMKQRIVEKLHALTLEDTPADKVDYLKDFMEEFHADRATIAAKCRLALKYLLLDYSKFNVSTIDSFFQSVLRTFAYETEIPDSYHLEIDSDFISKVGVDSVVDNFITSNIDHQTLGWIEDLTVESRNNDDDWNIQTRKASGGYKSTLYGTLINIAKQMDSEQFKKVSPQIEDYLAHHDLDAEAEYIDAQYLPSITKAYATLRKAATSLLAAYKRITPKGIKVTAVARKDAAANIFKIIARDADPATPKSWEAIPPGKSPLSTFLPDHKQLAPGLRPLYDAVSEAYEQWQKSFDQPGWEIWSRIRPLIPYIGLLFKFRTEVGQYLDNNNTIVIGDTNMLIHRIIGDDTLEVPFIYERIGTHLRHFLIDEFQDTSKMQWDNFRPLLEESLANYHENLIIGDAKQSIYRFRNADYTIINEKVKKAFDARQILERGLTKEDNSNWRSDEHIVRFNNTIFSNFHEDVQGILGDLYANAIQLPRRTTGLGYVEWQNGKGEDATKFGDLIVSLLARGYRQRDIALLFSANDNAMEMISQLMAYTSAEGYDGPELRFVSEVSLQLGNNASVQAVIAALESLADGIYTPPRPGDEELEKVPTDWGDIAVRFRLYSLSHPGESLSKQIADFMAQGKSDDSLTEMVSKMQAVTLPALVEAIIATFVPGRDEDAPFLSAFQDEVLSYCDSQCADLGSFLEWWHLHGAMKSISSPEGTDAIQVMTIHKSKGLEFDCVILPDIDIALEPSALRHPLKWVSLPQTFPYAEHLPKSVPIYVDKSLEDENGEGVWADEWHKERDMVMTDALNKIYVAFTRAISELYIFTSTSVNKDGTLKKGNKLAHRLEKYLIERFSRLADISEEEKPNHIDGRLLDGKTLINPITYGIKPSEEEIAKRIAKREKEAAEIPSETITTYFINPDQGMLQYEEDGFPRYVDDEDREDPRSEGSKIHAIFENMEIADDLHKAVERLRIRGMFNTAEGEGYESEIVEWLKDVEDMGWFDGSMRVLNERPMLCRGRRQLRPDRIMVDTDGNAIIIDYKCGTSQNNSKHRKQIGQYADILRQTGLYHSVTSYLWYLRERKVVRL